MFNEVIHVCKLPIAMHILAINSTGASRAARLSGNRRAAVGQARSWWDRL
jgi:hypothetical protein